MSEKDNAEVEETVLHMIAREKHVDRSLVSLDSTFEELAIDSLNAISLMFAFEETFQIDLPDSVVRELKTVRDLMKQVKQLVDAKSSPGGVPAPDASPTVSDRDPKNLSETGP